MIQQNDTNTTTTDPIPADLAGKDKEVGFEYFRELEDDDLVKKTGVTSA